MGEDTVNYRYFLLCKALYINYVYFVYYISLNISEKTGDLPLFFCMLKRAY